MGPKRKPIVQSKMHPAHHTAAPKRYSEPGMQVVPVQRPCTFCQHGGADFQCNVCGALYCGVECQLHDWLHHRAYQCIPRLVKLTPVYVSPEFWANMADPLNQSHSNNFPTMPPQPYFPGGNGAFQADFQKPPSVANFQRPASVDNLTKPSTRTKLVNPPDQENFSKQQAQAKFTKPPALANFPKQQAQVSFPKQPDHENFSMRLHTRMPANFTIPPPCVGLQMTPTQAITTKKTPTTVKVKQHKSQPASLSDHTTVAVADNRSSILSALLPNEPEAAVTKLAAGQLMPVAAEKRLVPFLEVGRTVRISHVGTNCIFVYGTGLEKGGAPNRYLAFMKQMIEAARKVEQFLHAPPSKGDIVFAPFERDHYRAVVKSFDGPNVNVFYPEFGNTATVAWALLKEIKNPVIKNEPVLIFKALIDNVTNFTQSQVDFLRPVVELEEFVLTKVMNMPNGNLKVIDMRHAQELYLLSDKLRALAANEELKKSTQLQNDLANTNPLTHTPVVAAEESEQNYSTASPLSTNDEAPTTPEPSDATTPTNLDALDIYLPALQLKHFSDPSLPTGNDVALLIVDVSELIKSNSITVVLHSEKERYNKLKDDCDRFGKSIQHPHRQPEPEEVVLVKRDGAWRRAVRANGEDDYLLLDLGCTYTLNDSSNIRWYPRTLGREIFTTDCIIDNPRILQFFIKSCGNEDGLVGHVLKADVFLKDEAVHIRVVDLLE